MSTALVTRDVAKGDRHNHLYRDVKAGEVFWVWHGVTYGCIDTLGGIALSEQLGQHPFFEFPRDAVVIG